MARRHDGDKPVPQGRNGWLHRCVSHRTRPDAEGGEESAMLQVLDDARDRLNAIGRETEQAR